MSAETQWWVSTDMIGKPGSPKTAGPFSTRDDAFNARKALEAMGANLSVFEEAVKPAVVLPTEPTLGWVVTHERHDLDFWSAKRHNDAYFPGSKAGLDGNGRGYAQRMIRDWVPATAVPTSALNELRASFRRIAPGVVLTLQEKSIRTFLAAVDEAAR